MGIVVVARALPDRRGSSPRTTSTLGELRAAGYRRVRSRRSCAPTCSAGWARRSRSSPASSATTRRSSRRSRTRSWPARTSASWASAARPRRASPGCSSACSTRGCRRRRRRAERRPAGARSRRRPGSSWRARATRRRSPGCRAARYSEKLATPDITIADLIGEVDPVKVAEGRYLADELDDPLRADPARQPGHLHLNELPDLAERIQVGLLNILEERDVQVRGYTLRLPLDLFVVASANPEDYTSRGRIITPLKDRLGSQIRTHYPRTIEDEIAIMRQERTLRGGDGMPGAGRGARVHARARRRAVAARPPLTRGQPALGRQRARQHRQPRDARRRASSAPSAWASLGRAADQRPARAGRLDGRQDRARDARRRDARGAGRRPAAGTRRGQRLQPAVELDELEPLVEAFEGPRARDRRARAVGRLRWAREVPGLARSDRAGWARANRRHRVASAVEFLLEGLHLNRRLNKDRTADGAVTVAEPAPLPDGEGAADLRPPAGLVGAGPYRYARWDGRQRLPDLAADELLDAIGDDLLADGDLSSALGGCGSAGCAGRPSVTGWPACATCGRAWPAPARSTFALPAGRRAGRRAAELDEIVATERRGLERRLFAAGDGAPLRRPWPPTWRRGGRRSSTAAGGVGGRLIRRYQDYDFMEPEARAASTSCSTGCAAGARFILRRPVRCDPQVTPEQLAATARWCASSTGCCSERLAGGDPDASDFLARHGRSSPARRRSTTSSSSSPRGWRDAVAARLAERRAASELQQMMDSLLRDDRLRWDLAQLARRSTSCCRTAWASASTSPARRR
jgi:magnesium chelatase subunit I